MKEKIPVTILTGFLGSGKTTLLNRILNENHGKKIAVIENEFGEVGVDNELVINADEEIFEMNNGCICCTVRGDLIRILTQLSKRKDKLDMILIETTGLANPAPVAQTFFVDEDVKELFSLDAIITIVDAQHVLLHIYDSDECKEQIAFADIILLNKTDLVNEEELQLLERTLRSMNAMSKIYRTQNATIDLQKILNIEAFNLQKKTEINPEFITEEFPFEAIVHHTLQSGEYQLLLENGPDPSIDIFITQTTDDLEKLKHQATIAFSENAIITSANGVIGINNLYQLNINKDTSTFKLSIPKEGKYSLFTQHGPDEFNLQLLKNNALVSPLEVIEIEHSHTHNEEVTSVGIENSGSLNGALFDMWISELLQTKGTDIFRSKGILNIHGVPKRIVFQGVHMLFDAKPDRDWKENEIRKNQLVFIGKNLNRNEIVSGFEKCLI